ncbi:hypothetical protein, partial [Escherichia coli]
PHLEAPAVAAETARQGRLGQTVRAMFRLAIERSHARVGLVGLAFAGVFGTISVKLLAMAAFGEPPSQEHRVAAASTTAIRPD